MNYHVKFGFVRNVNYIRAAILLCTELDATRFSP